MADEPQTLFEEHHDMASGCRVAVRAASFAVGDERRGAVTVTVSVPDGFYLPIEGGGLSASASALADPADARAFARMLEGAADAADTAGPPLHGTP